jgi:hypothetical protein
LFIIEQTDQKYLTNCRTLTYNVCPLACQWGRGLFLILPVAIPPMHIKTHILLYFSVHTAFTTPSLLCVIYWPVHPSLSLINNIPPLHPTDMMQLTPFIFILGILFGITLDHDAYAIPLTREQTGVVTLPLQQTPMRRDLHPHMVCPLCSCSSKVYSSTIDQLLQMHNARAQRRLARMTGRAVSFDNNDPKGSSTCVFLTSVFTSLSLKCAQRYF